MSKQENGTNAPGQKNKKILVNKEKINIEGFITCTQCNAKTGKIIKKTQYKNTITVVCHEMIADRIAGGSGNCDLTYGAVGSGIFPASPEDSTTLVTEEDRNQVSYASASGSIITARVYFGPAEANATLTEFAWFGQGATGVADSGVMLNHLSISETKTSAETLTIEGSIQIG